MPWRYGVVKFKRDDSSIYYGIGEIYYDKDPLKPYACSSRPIEPYAGPEDTTEDKDILENDDSGEYEHPITRIGHELRNMIKDVDKYPVWDIDGIYEKREV